MEDVVAIRRLVRADGWSIRRVARELGVARNTVRRYLAGAEPRVRAAAARATPVLDGVRARLDTLLAESAQWTAGKQRLTATRLHALLLEEGHPVGVTLVKAYVAAWRRRQREVFVPLEYAPGDLGEVDFFEVWVDVGGVRTKAYLFVLRCMYSGRDFAWLYPRQDQVCFLDGHVRAFAHLGGVLRRVLYDNLRPAVARVLAGAERQLTARMQALVAHYAFEPCFARPGTGHDKGGVEARGRVLRWQELVPIPQGPDLDAISTALLARLDARQSRPRARGQETIGTLWATEQTQLLALPPTAFRAAALRVVPVSRRALVHVEGTYYSVPCTWADTEATAYIGPTTVELVGADGGRVTHRRGRFGERVIDYRHYLAVLARKPQAVRQVATSLVRDLGEPYAAAWARLVAQHGPKEAARHFARVLDAVVTRGDAVVAACLRDALATATPLALAVAAPPAPPVQLATDALPPQLAALDIATARVADYDALLRGAA